MYHGRLWSSSCLRGALNRAAWTCSPWLEPSGVGRFDSPPGPHGLPAVQTLLRSRCSLPPHLRIARPSELSAARKELHIRDCRWAPGPPAPRSHGAAAPPHSALPAASSGWLRQQPVWPPVLPAVAPVAQPAASRLSPGASASAGPLRATQGVGSAAGWQHWRPQRHLCAQAGHRQAAMSDPEEDMKVRCHACAWTLSG